MPPNPARLLDHLRRLARRRDRDPSSDGALLSRFVSARDGAAFEELVQRHGPMIYAVCRRALHDAHAAEDALQATFLVLARRASTVRPGGSLAAWLHGVARRVVFRAGAALRRRRLRESATPVADPSDGRQRDPLSELTAREFLATVDEEVARLPEVYRLPVLLCCLEGRTQEEAARLLGWTVGSVKGRLERGRKRLYERLAKRGLAPSAMLGVIELTREAATAFPSGLLTTTVQAATLVGACETAGPIVVRHEVLVLLEGVQRAMLWTKLKTILAVLLTLGVLGAVTGLFAARPRQEEPAARAEVPQSGAPGPPPEGAPAEEKVDLDECALLLIEDREPRLLPDARRLVAVEDDVASFRRTQVVLLRSRPVLRGAA